MNIETIDHYEKEDYIVDLDAIENTKIRDKWEDLVMEVRRRDDDPNNYLVIRTYEDSIKMEQYTYPTHTFEGSHLVKKDGKEYHESNKEERFRYFFKVVTEVLEEIRFNGSKDLRMYAILD